MLFASRLSLSVLFFVLLCLGLQMQAVADEDRPNVLFIAVDDLRPELGCYGAAHVHSPNIDSLAKTGRLFHRAYCQQAICNPSRTSLLTGMRPDSTGVTGNHKHFRTEHPDVVTLPQCFKESGYHAAAIGKIYHGVFPDGASKTSWDTMGDPQSWSVPAVRFGPRYYYTEEGITVAKKAFLQSYKPTNPLEDDWTKKLVFGLATESPDVPDNVLYDGKVADQAVETLGQLKDARKPFFLAVGFIKPHSPYIAPKRYFDLYTDVPLPKHTSFPSDSPQHAGHASGELRRYVDQPRRGEIPIKNRRDVRHAYFACISYVDAQIGRVLSELDRTGLSKSTIVVLLGDHGYHLGEQGLWGKTTNFELDTRVPLIVRTPGMQAAGQPSHSLVELVDLYPTLLQLARLPNAGVTRTGQLDGKSLVSILDDPVAETKPIALSQYPRGRLMGYSLRNATHRITQWLDSSGQIQATELYDYTAGLIETRNIASESVGLVGKLTTQLLAAFQVAAESQGGESQGADSTACGFESAKAGEFKKLSTSVGTWRPTSGRTIVDNKHAKTGKQCLQLTGGKETRLTLDLAEGIEASGELTFWAERWTKRSPFQFRIEKRRGNQWKEVFNGDDVVKVGRPFLSHVKVPLGDGDIRQLRFTVKSPPSTGVLIDDVRIAPARPQQIVDVQVVPHTLPVLVGKAACPLVKLQIKTTGRLNPISLSQLSGSLDASTDPSDIESLLICRAGSDFSNTESIASDGVSGDMAFDFIIPDAGYKLDEGINHVWVACKLKSSADVDGGVGARCSNVVFSNGESFKLQQPSSVQRLGVAVRRGGDDGVHTYRIPGLATTNKGTLIGVYDVRRRGGRDLPGDIDVGMSRSTDGGRTWEPMKVVMDMGDDPDWRYDGVGDPAVLVDQNTGTIWVAGTWSHGNRSWVGSGPGMKPEETGQLMLVRSDDDGVTWSKPINITTQVKRPEWCFILQGPGKGITMRDGTIVFAAQYQDPPDQKRLPHSTIIYSKDHGETWQAGSGAFDDTTESQVVELEPGVLMLNCRYNRASTRVVMTTRDMGKTWQKHATSERSLIEPGSCMASLIDVDQETAKERGGYLLFSNPDSTRGRHHITIKASSDRGQTWPKANRLLLDQGNGRGYSCLSMIDNETVGILYEGSQADMTFQRIKLDDLISEKEVAKPGPVDDSSLKLPSVFGHHMVLQANAQIPVWGSGSPGESVVVSFGHESKTCVVNEHGRWQLRLSPCKSTAVGRPFTVVSGGQQIVLTDVVVGEVWLCAGQSNMEWALTKTDDGEKQLRDLSTTPTIGRLRLLNLNQGPRGSSGNYTAQHVRRLEPSRYCEGKWAVASEKSASEFSAVAWYFGRHLQNELGGPVGLICPAAGGTPTEAWIPREALESDPSLNAMVHGNWLDNEQLGDFCRQRGEQNLLAVMQAGESIPGDAMGPNHSYKPGFMWSAGIEPLIPYAIRGAIWYQGESNAETFQRVQQHGKLFPLMIGQWRQRWGQGDFPFLYVQLPSLKRAQWPAFREQQRRALSEINNVGMAVTIDTGDRQNVHPRQKKLVGERLAKWALGTTYQLQSNKNYSGPLLKNAASDNEKMVVSFDHSASGLVASDRQPLRHFEVCGQDRVFHSANANVVSADTVQVWSTEVAKPIHVRYAWKEFPTPAVNFFNGDGLPASPFTTEEELVSAVGTAAEESGRPNILLIVGEDHGCELSCYGDDVISTPHIDRLAAQGVLFENGYVTQSVCSPSRSTIFTGLYPHQNGQLGLATHNYRWFKKWPTTYSLLKRAGYRTGLIGKTHVLPEEAVEPYVDFRFQRKSNFAKRNVAEYANRAGEFFRAGDEPFFMTVNYPDAHWPLQGKVDGLPVRQVDPKRVKVMPYVGGENDRMLGVVGNYYDCMLRLDACVGQLLKQLDESGKADNTLVVFVGDHGAQMARGKVTVYEAGMKVPFIARWPGVTRAGNRSDALVSTIDLLPTFMDVAGQSTPDGLPGKTLRPALSGQVDADFRQYVVCERNCDAARHTFPQRTIRDARYKLIHSPVRDREDPAARYYRDHGASHWSGCLTDEELKSASHQTQEGYARWLRPPEFQLYDLQADPHEWNDLAGNPGVLPTKERLHKALMQWQVATSDPMSDHTKLQQLLDENDAVFKAGRRSPKDGWQYLKYLAPVEPNSILSLAP